jgi:hypothetical protein
MKKNLTLFLSLFLSALSHQASAQSTIYTQNFDFQTSLPAGWYATANAWYVDTTLGNISSGYTGASGVNNVVIKDTTATAGNDSLITADISTVGYKNITIEWGTRFSKHFADSGSTISLYWSIDSTTWNNVAYVENTNNSTWGLENDSTPIALPAGAANQPALKLMWVADIHFTPSGTYRIDDLTVTGTSTVGISEIAANTDFAKVFVNTNSEISISLSAPVTGNTYVELYDLNGKIINQSDMNTQDMMINAKNLAQGIYMVRVYDSKNNTITKVLIK